jgi:hypothetical protein
MTVMRGYRVGTGRSHVLGAMRSPLAAATPARSHCILVAADLLGLDGSGAVAPINGAPRCSLHPVRDTLIPLQARAHANFHAQPYQASPLTQAVWGYNASHLYDRSGCTSRCIATAAKRVSCKHPLRMCTTAKHGRLHTTAHGLLSTHFTTVAVAPHHDSASGHQCHWP